MTCSSPLLGCLLLCLQIPPLLGHTLHQALDAEKLLGATG